MRALVKTRPARGMDLLEVPDPTPGPGEVLLRVQAAAVCGSDIARYAWSRNYEAGAPKAMTDNLPRIMGHELAGIVVEVGPGTTGTKVGERVAVMNILGCGRCRDCQRGRPNLCVDRRTIGVDRDGGYAELAAIPEENAVPIPLSMSFHLAAAVTPFAVASYAVGHAELEPGSRILIWGAGPIGLGVLFAARLRGVERALVVDVRRDRLQLAEQHGAETLDVSTGDPATALAERVGRRAVDAVFEAAGAPESVPASLLVLRKGCPIVLIGNMRAAGALDLMPLIMDQQRIVGSRATSIAAWTRSLRTIEGSGFESILGDEVRLEEAVARFEAAADGSGDAFTILPNGAIG
jgi:threonine dehydrogenase-like Zn-dependent dehydrogenase